jgi:predicted GH43/DUF377 family glycosyl hydrolase
MFEEKTLLLVRVEDKRGFSHLTKATSEDGYTDWQIDSLPTFLPDFDSQEEAWGIEDPRITYVPELEKYAIVYTGYSYAGPCVCLAFTKDFVNFERCGMLMPADDKDAALFPRKFDDKWLLIHRPIINGGHIWISGSEDLKTWSNAHVLINARRGAWWDANKVGLSPPPLETPEGWLVMYHGVRVAAAGALYRVGLALLDLEEPYKMIRRCEEWVFGPDAFYEKYGDVDNVVFPCGWIWDKEEDRLRLYYGAADSYVAVATAAMSDVMSHVLSCTNLEIF